MTAKQVTVADLFSEASMLARRHAVLLGLVWAATATGLATLNWYATDLGDDNMSLLVSSLAGFVVSIFVQYLVTEQLLADRRHAGSEHRQRRYGSLFVAGLLSGLAIVVGLILLILPGLYLAGRWFTSSARIVEGNLGGIEALGESWQDSLHSVPAFTLGVVLSFVPLIPVIGIAAAAASPDSQFIESLPGIFLSDAASALTSVVGWVLGVAAFRKAVPVDTGLDEVFA